MAGRYRNFGYPGQERHKPAGPLTTKGFRANHQATPLCLLYLGGSIALDGLGSNRKTTKSPRHQECPDSLTLAAEQQLHPPASQPNHVRKFPRPHSGGSQPPPPLCVFVPWWFNCLGWTRIQSKNRKVTKAPRVSGVFLPPLLQALNTPNSWPSMPLLLGGYTRLDFGDRS